MNKCNLIINYEAKLQKFIRPIAVLMNVDLSILTLYKNDILMPSDNLYTFNVAVHPCKTFVTY